MSASPTRLKRITPERSGPIRNPIRPMPFGADQTARPGPSPFGTLENGVRTAYAVIDDYLRRGQEAARGIYNDSNRRDDMSDYRGNFGGYNPWNPLAMLTEQWMVAMRAWTQAMSAMMPGAWQSPWNPGAFGAPAPKLTVQVSSARPSEVSAVLFPGVEFCELTCDALRPDGATGAPIDPPAISMEPGAVRVSVKVGDQPAGKYRGSIRKRMDNSPAGEVSVTIS